MATGFRLGMALLCSSLAAAFDAALVAVPRRAAASLLLRRRLLASSREGRVTAAAEVMSLREEERDASAYRRRPFEQGCCAVGRVGVTGRIVVQGRVPTALRRWDGALGTDAGQRQRTQIKISSACVAIAPVGARAFHVEQALPLVVRDARIHLVSAAVCVWSHQPPVTS